MQQANCKRVLILGIDGVGTAAMNVPTPNLDRVFRRGAWTDQAKSVLPTISAQCWGAMLLGVGPDKHGLTNDGISTSAYPLDSPYPTIFRQLREQRPDAVLASFSAWNPINTGILEQNLDCHFTTGKDAPLVRTLAAYLEEHDPTLLFLDLDDCDAAGHRHGYFTAGHYDAIREADGHIGIVLDVLERRGMWEDSLILLVTDHGGGGETSTDHGTAHPQDATVFWGLCGPGQQQGATLGPVSITDTAAVALHALGLPIPAYFEGKVPAGVL